jgi:hypothetical protein
MRVGEYISNLIAKPFDVPPSTLKLSTIKLPRQNWIRFQEVGTGQMS